MARNFLWFAEADVETTADAILVASDSFLHADPITGGVILYFKEVQGGEAARETVKLACTNGNQKDVMEAFARILQSHPHGSGSPIVVADYNVANGQTAIGAHAEFGSLVTDVVIT